MTGQPGLVGVREATVVEVTVAITTSVGVEVLVVADQGRLHLSPSGQEVTEDLLGQWNQVTGSALGAPKAGRANGVVMVAGRAGPVLADRMTASR